MFEWEEHADDLRRIDSIGLICRAIVRVQGITEHSLPESWAHASGIATKELF